MVDVLAGLAAKVAANPTSLETFRRTQRPLAAEPGTDATDAVTARVLAERVEAMLTPTTTLIAETGDSWFHATKMRLPEGASFEIQMKYGSIGWSVGAALGAAVAGGGDRQIVAMIGDGSFQMTVQEVSTMVRLGVPVTLFVINNGGYTIEVEIHDGPYNVIQDWRYAELIDVFSTVGGPATGVRVTTVGELDAAVAAAAGAGGVNLVEVVIDRDDCSDELLDWGSRVLANNTRAPHDTIIL
jgi:TPP-dependent 2-oxoacid decarboxylase